MLQNVKLEQDGKQVLNAWNDPSAESFGSDGKVSNSERDLLSNQEKTNDELRAIFSGWQYDVAWTAYNEQNELRMGEVDVFARSLFLYGEAARAEEAKYGLHPEYSDAAF